MVGIKKYFVDDIGATAIEYALIAAMLSIVIAGAVLVVGQQTGSHFSQVEDAMRSEIEED